MEYLPEAIGLAVIMAALFIYLLNNNPGYKRKKQALMQRHRVIRNRSSQLQTNITNHILEHDSSKFAFMDTTLEQGLARLKKKHFAHLSEKNYKKLKATHNRLALFRKGRNLNSIDRELSLLENEFQRIKK